MKNDQEGQARWNDTGRIREDDAQEKFDVSFRHGTSAPQDYVGPVIGAFLKDEPERLVEFAG